MIELHTVIEIFLKCLDKTASAVITIICIIGIDYSFIFIYMLTLTWIWMSIINNKVVYAISN